jgi:hypothetical protein
MDHAVHYRTADGAMSFEEASSLDAAVEMVERLRNDEGVSDVRVYKQVPIEFKAYYKVSVVSEAGPSPAAAPVASPEPAQPDATPAAAAAPQSPPPGAMPLGPATPFTPPAAQPSTPQDEGTDAGRRGSLFSRG